MSSFVRAFSVSYLSSATASLAQEKRQSEFHPSWWRSRVTESMSVLTDPTTYGNLSSELTNCQWQQMMATLQRVEQEMVSSQSLVNAIENVSQTRSDATGGDCDGGMENDSIRRTGRAAHHLEGSHAGSRHGWDMSTQSTRQGS